MERQEFAGHSVWPLRVVWVGVSTADVGTPYEPCLGNTRHAVVPVPLRECVNGVNRTEKTWYIRAVAPTNTDVRTGLASGARLSRDASADLDVHNT